MILRVIDLVEKCLPVFNSLRDAVEHRSVDKDLRRAVDSLGRTVLPHLDSSHPCSILVVCRVDASHLSRIKSELGCDRRCPGSLEISLALVVGENVFVLREDPVFVLAHHGFLRPMAISEFFHKVREDLRD